MRYPAIFSSFPLAGSDGRRVDVVFLVDVGVARVGGGAGVAGRDSGAGHAADVGGAVLHGSEWWPVLV